MKRLPVLGCLSFVLLKFPTMLGCQAGPPRLQRDDGGSLGGAVAVYPDLPPAQRPEDTTDANPWLSFGQDPEDPTPSGTSGSPGTEGSGGASQTPETQGSGAGGTLLDDPNPPPPAEGPTPSGQTPVPDEPPVLRFVGYFESTGAAKLLVIDHLAGGPTEDCSVEIYSNGGAEPWRRLALADGIEAGQRQVLCLPDAHHPACSQVLGGSAFNGNDALRLACREETQDVFGVIGVDPGSGWTGSGSTGAPVSTEDQGLWRCVDPQALLGSPTTFLLTEWAPWTPSADAALRGADCSPPEGPEETDPSGHPGGAAGMGGGAPS